MTKLILDRSSTGMLAQVDLSPINIDFIKKSVARSVNIKMGIKDGGNVKIAVGRVMYPSDQEAKRIKVLKTAIFD